MATQEELNQIYNEELGRDVDRSGAETYKDMSVDDLRSALQGSVEYGFKQRHDAGEESDATWDSFWKEYSGSMGFETGGYWADASGNQIDGAFMNDRAPEDSTWVNTVQGGFDMNRAHELFDSYQAQGMFADEMAFHMPNTRTYQMDERIYAPMARGQHWYDEGMTTEDAFGASHAGDLVIVKEGQNMYQDHYQDITDRLGGLVPEGYVAYQDMGDQDGGRGLSGVIDDAFNTNFTDTYDAWMPNEGNNFMAGGGTGTALVWGSDIRDEGYQAQGDLIGVNAEEVATTNDLAENITVAIGSWYSGGYGLLVAAAGRAALSGGKKISGSQAERDRQRWSEIAEESAWTAASTGAGTYGAAAIAGYRAYEREGEWEDVLYASGGSYLSSTLGGDSNVWGVAGRAGGNVLATRGLTGNWDSSWQALGSSLAADTARGGAYVAGVSANQQALMGIGAQTAVGYAFAGNPQQRNAVLWNSSASLLEKGVQGIGSSKKAYNPFALGSFKSATTSMTTPFKVESWLNKDVYNTDNVTKYGTAPNGRQFVLEENPDQSNWFHRPSRLDKAETQAYEAKHGVGYNFTGNDTRSFAVTDDPGYTAEEQGAAMYREYGETGDAYPHVPQADGTVKFPRGMPEVTVRGIPTTPVSLPSVVNMLNKRVQLNAARLERKKTMRAKRRKDYYEDTTWYGRAWDKTKKTALYGI